MGWGKEGISNTKHPTPINQLPITNYPLPNAQCPMPNAQCPMPNAQCPIPINLYKS
ncbi:hypothetical protein IQ278_24580 [Tolypothrix sp. LEGE 11397]|uniref:hypothetical protein n=1 Tax=Tolypothrix sp. LEGE 11397 TaxID=2777971 RepID=UPI0005EAACAB|nr:hypothetical protein [Tolypothrix sp. LEGE 11397]EKE98539.1 hypothetical protein FDUTEX481_03842 [Tolypothrix sp. PCC 7601]MBE9085239.1 hypothetical protein [Tolypothrix sp. LEGE 11397]